MYCSRANTSRGKALRQAQHAGRRWPKLKKSLEGWRGYTTLPRYFQRVRYLPLIIEQKSHSRFWAFAQSKLQNVERAAYIFACSMNDPRDRVVAPLNTSTL